MIEFRSVAAATGQPQGPVFTVHEVAALLPPELRDDARGNGASLLIDGVLTL